MTRYRRSDARAPDHVRPSRTPRRPFLMSLKRKCSRRRRSRSVPLSLVPALAALVTVTGCSSNVSRPIDPCDADSYLQSTCDSAVVNRGYYYGGTWYPHVYPYAAMYYLGRHNSYIAGGGRVRT